MKRRKSKGEYLAALTAKYDIHPDILFCALLSAGEIGEAACGPLSVECRGKTKDKVYYLIKEGATAIAQLPISKEFLERHRNPIRDFMETDLVKKIRPKELESGFYSKIGELKVGQKNINLKAEIKEISKPSFVDTQFGNRIRLAKALLKDETGEISLCLWKEQIDSVSPGDYVELLNVKVRKYRGNKQLNTHKGSSIEIISKSEDAFAII